MFQGGKMNYVFIPSGYANMILQDFISQKSLFTKQMPEGYGNWEDRLETGMVASTDL